MSDFFHKNKQENEKMFKKQFLSPTKRIIEQGRMRACVPLPLDVTLYGFYGMSLHVNVSPYTENIQHR
jgi:hypothetical protein